MKSCMEALDVWLQGFAAGLGLCLVLFLSIWLVSRQVARRNVQRMFDELGLTQALENPDDERRQSE